MIKGYVRYCDRCGVELTKANNTCGFELCDKCNEALEQQLAIKNDLAGEQLRRLGMNREEAINFANCLKNNYTVDLNDMEAFCDMAIKALEQEPTTKNNLGVDCISRADAIKAMQDKAKKLKNEDTINGLCGAVAILYEMPSVTPQLSVPEVTALAEWTEKLTKASEEAYNKGYADGMKAQEPRKGHWIKTPKAVMGEGYMWYCDKCEHQVYQDSSRSYPSEKYCPNCGSDNRKVEV